MKPALEKALTLLREHPGDVPQNVADEIETILQGCLNRISPS